MIQLSDIISERMLQKYANLRPVIPDNDWTMEMMLEAVTQIGQTIEPRFVIDAENRDVYENLIYWLMNNKRMRCKNPITGETIPGRLDRGLYLAGNTGSGKTLAMSIIRKLYARLPMLTYDKQVIEWEEYRAEQISDRFAITGDITGIKGEKMLCIQDLGSEPEESLYMGNRMDVMRYLIEGRGDQRFLVTHVTSNIPLGHPDLKKRYGDRAVSRLIEMTNYLVLAGKDRRLKLI